MDVQFMPIHPFVRFTCELFLRISFPQLFAYVIVKRLQEGQESYHL